MMLLGQFLPTQYIPRRNVSFSGGPSKPTDSLTRSRSPKRSESPKPDRPSKPSGSPARGESPTQKPSTPPKTLTFFHARGKAGDVKPKAHADDAKWDLSKPIWLSSTTITGDTNTTKYANTAEAIKALKKECECSDGMSDLANKENALSSFDWAEHPAHKFDQASQKMGYRLGIYQLGYEIVDEPKERPKTPPTSPLIKALSLLPVRQKTPLPIATVDPNTLLNDNDMEALIGHIRRNQVADV